MLKHAVNWSVWFSRCYSTKVDKNVLSKLRKRTGISFINCKKALIKFDNDFEQAEKWLQEEAKKEGWAKATKLQDRSMSQGLIGLISDNSAVTMIEVNCETDFVARTDKFKNFVSNLTSVCHQQNQNENVRKTMLLKTEASQMKSGSDGTIADIVAMEIGNIGENMQLRRTLFFKATDDFLLGTYMYSSGKPLKIRNCHLGKFGAVVEFKQTKNGENQKLTPPSVIGHQLCQHIVGMNPKSIGSSDEKPNENVGMNPKSIGSSDEKPNENKEEESQLIYQELLVDPEITVGEMLSENNVTVTDFVRFEIGEELPEESVKNEVVKETASVL